MIKIKTKNSIKIIYIISILLITSCTPSLINSVKKNDYEKAKESISSGTDVNIKSRKGLTPLHIATNNNNIKIVELLLEKGANVNIDTSSIGLKPIHIACYNNNNNIEMVKLLLSHGAKVNVKKSSHWYTPLLYAVKNDNVEIAKLLINNDAQVNVEIKTYYGKFTPLIYSVVNNNIDMMKLLINNGAVFILNEDGVSESLFRAVKKRNTEMTKYLLELGAIDHSSICLAMAVSNNDYYTTEVLIINGFNVDATPSANGVTPLFVASTKGYLNIVKLLVENGAVIDKDNSSNVTPIFFAALNCHDDIVDYLIAMGADCEISVPNYINEEEKLNIYFVQGFICKIQGERYRKTNTKKESLDKYNIAVAIFDQVDKGFDKLANKEASKQFWGTVGNALAGTVNDLNYRTNYQSTMTKSTYNQLRGDGYSTFSTQEHGDSKRYYREKSRLAEEQIKECREKINMIK